MESDQRQARTDAVEREFPARAGAELARGARNSNLAAAIITRTLEERKLAPKVAPCWLRAEDVERARKRECENLLTACEHDLSYRCGQW